MNPKLRHLTSALCAISLFSDLPGERVLRGEDPDPGGGGGGGGGGGNEPPAKTFTQDELDRIVQKRVAEIQKKFADYDQLKEAASKVPDFEKQLAELNEKLELAGKSEQEKAKLLAEKLQAQQAAQLAAANKERDEAKQAAESAKSALQATQIRYAATAALTAAKALPASMKHAAALFVAETKIESELDEESGTVSIKSIEVDGVPYADPTKAAEAWLKVNPHFATAPAGGGGTRNPNGGLGGKSFDNMNAVDLAEAGLEAALNKR